MKILKSTVLCLSASALFFCAMIAPGRAATIVSVNFNGMSTGALAAVSPAVGALPVTAPWQVNLPAGTTATVANGFSATNSPFTSFGSGNVLVVDRTIGSGNSNINFEVNAADRITSGIASVKFNLMIDNRTSIAPSGNLSLSIRNSDYSPISSLTISNAGVLTLNGYAVPGTSNSSLAIGNLASALSYTIEMRLDFSTGLSQTYVNGVAMGGTQAFVTTKGVVGLVIAPASNSVGRWAFDDIVVETIPEPSAGALFSGAALVGLVLMARRREKTAA